MSWAAFKSWVICWKPVKFHENRQMQMACIGPFQHAFEHSVLSPNSVVAEFRWDTSLSQSMWYTMCVGARFRKDALCDLLCVQWENLAFVVARFCNDMCKIAPSMSE